MTSVEVMMMMMMIMMIMMMLQRASVLHKQLQAGLVFRSCHDTGIEDCVVGFQNGVRPMFTLWTFFDQCSLFRPTFTPWKRIRMCKLALHDSSSKTAREFPENIQEQRPLLHYNRAHNWAAVPSAKVQPLSVKQLLYCYCTMVLWSSCCCPFTTFLWARRPM